jgi:hypothetical protein
VPDIGVYNEESSNDDLDEEDDLKESGSECEDLDEEPEDDE